MKLCVALDLPTKQENLDLVKKIKDYNVWLKVGLRTYIRDGENFLIELKKINPNFKIFLDLKLHDIPNTMADAAESIAGLGVDMFNVHASAGKKAMVAVMERLQKFENRPIVLAVTALTSFDNESFEDIYGDNITEKANEFAMIAFMSGLDGVVSSVFESKEIKYIISNDFITLCPGIRPFGEDAGDQARVADLQTAKAELADFIVVGRPIYKAENPAQVVEKILAKL
ncbi:orotidine-5'-phosphate decarboxylase [Patescibacteria group bacterium]